MDKRVYAYKKLFELLHNVKCLEAMVREVGPAPMPIRRDNFKYTGQTSYFDTVKLFEELTEEKLNEEIIVIEKEMLENHNLYGQITELQQAYLTFKNKIEQKMMHESLVKGGGKHRCVTMHRFNTDFIAVDYVENNVGIFTQDTIIENYKEVYESARGGFLKCAHSFSQILLLGFSTGVIVVLQINGSKFSQVNVLEFDGISPEVIKSFANGKHIFVGT